MCHLVPTHKDSGSDDVVYVLDVDLLRRGDTVQIFKEGKSRVIYYDPGQE